MATHRTIEHFCTDFEPTGGGPSSCARVVAATDFYDRRNSYTVMPLEQWNEGVTVSIAKSNSWFTRFARVTSVAAGRPATFFAAVAVIVTWAVSGPLFH